LSVPAKSAAPSPPSSSPASSAKASRSPTPREHRPDRVEESKFVQVDVLQGAQLAAFVKGVDAIVSAAPYFLNKAIASVCAKAGVSYFDLTEDVDTTAFIQKLAKKAPKATFMPQCGLAPVRSTSWAARSRRR